MMKAMNALAIKTGLALLLTYPFSPAIAQDITQVAIQTTAQKPLPLALTITILIGITLVLVLSLGVIIRTLHARDWNLALALSEEADLPPGTATPEAGQLPPTIPSSSRLIALIGTVIIGTFFIAIGYYLIWQICNDQPITGAKDAMTLILSGSALFLPYGVNKIASMSK
jgi:hypothetical protein